MPQRNRSTGRRAQARCPALLACRRPASPLRQRESRNWTPDRGRRHAWGFYEEIDVSAARGGVRERSVYTEDAIHPVRCQSVITVLDKRSSRILALKIHRG